MQSTKYIIVGILGTRNACRINVATAGGSNEVETHWPDCRAHQKRSSGKDLAGRSLVFGALVGIWDTFNFNGLSRWYIDEVQNRDIGIHE